MIDPWWSLAAFAYALAAAGPRDAQDPGASSHCPRDMRLVEGRHWEQTYQLCTDVRTPERPRCWRYHEGLRVLEGEPSAVRVCVDQFEAPNVRGAKPLVLYSYRDAVRWCARKKKRLCSEREWELACEGPEGRPWAYGWAVAAALCNSNKKWIQVDFHAFGRERELALAETERLWQGTPSGHFPTCISHFGLYDMMGNVEEWVTGRDGRRYRGALMGGFWSKAWTGCRGTNDAHEPDFAFYETGFRCCKDPPTPTE